MKKQAEFIKRIVIKGLWGRKDIAWDLRKDVNILSGVNGIGKSSILNSSVRRLNENNEVQLTNGIKDIVTFTFSPEDADFIPFDVIRSFDRPLIDFGLLKKIGDQDVRTELDWQLYQLQRRYLDYQVNIGNRIIELLTSGDPEKQMMAAEISKPKTKFQDPGRNDNGHRDPHKNRKHEPNAFLELLAQMGDGMDQFVIDPHGHHHGPSADSRNNIGDSDHKPLKQFLQHGQKLSFTSSYNFAKIQIRSPFLPPCRW